VHEIQKIAKEKGCTSAQLAIGWVKHLSKKDGTPEIIPIPGASTAERVKENATDITITQQEMEEIDSILQRSVVAGGRYGGPGAAHIEG